MRTIVTLVIMMLVGSAMRAAAQDSTNVALLDSLATTAAMTAFDDSVRKANEPSPSPRQRFEKIKQRVRDHFDAPFDTVRDDNYWQRAALHGKLDLKDESVKYPGFLDFVVDAYRWGDHAFNYYDSAYVVGTGTKWKFMLKNNNWLDTYNGKIDGRNTRLQMNSRLTSNFGAQISFMALSLSYMFNLQNLISGERMKNTQWDFSFTSSRVALELYYNKKDESTVLMHELGDFNGRYEFDGLLRESWGLYAYYFFNHLHYGHAAAYCFSKYQLRSAGSFIAGIHSHRQELIIDFTKLDDDMRQYLSDPSLEEYRIRYHDYCVALGYGYNWVPRRDWLINITVLPSIGYRQSFDNSTDGKRGLLSTNMHGKMAIVRNKGRWFYGLHFLTDVHWYHSPQTSFFSSNHDFNVTAGIRF